MPCVYFDSQGEVKGGDIQGAGRAKREEEVRWTLLPHQGHLFSVC